MKVKDAIKINKLVREFMEEYPYGTNNYAHLSWDLLMPVIKKISGMNYYLEDHELNRRWYEKFQAIRNSLVSIDIERTFDNIIDFIHWYNENKHLIK